MGLGFVSFSHQAGIDLSPASVGLLKTSLLLVVHFMDVIVII